MKRTLKNQLQNELAGAIRTKNKKRLIIIALIFAALFFYSHYRENKSNVLPYEDGSLKIDEALAVHYIDIGQGDAAYIRLPTGESMLIDAGPNDSETQLLAYLNRYDVDELDYAVFTHPHEDHIGGADVIMKNITVKNVIIPDVEAMTSTYDRMLDYIIDSNANLIFAEPDQMFMLGEAEIRIWAPISPSEEDLNDASVVLKLSYRDVSFVFTGDAEIASENEILDRYLVTELKADVLKIGHHGSSTSTSERFLRALSPSVAVISCAKNNDYGHPHRETVALLNNYNIQTFRTDQLGSVRIYSDGRVLLVQSDKENSAP